jgi:hypothetical protein
MAAGRALPGEAVVGGRVLWHSLLAGRSEMSDDKDLDLWLHKKISWMVNETSQYFDTRELLSLCQTVAIMNLNDSVKALAKLQVEGKKK